MADLWSAELHNTLSCSCLLRVPHRLQNISMFKNCLPHLWQNMVRDRPYDSKLSSLVAFWIQNGGDVTKPLTQTDCGRTYGTWHFSFFFLRFSKYFLGFHVDFWIAYYFLIREKFICVSNIFIRICNSFLDLKSFPTRICKKYCDLKFFFGFENYFWIVPFRLP